MQRNERTDELFNKNSKNPEESYIQDEKNKQSYKCLYLH